MANRVWVVSDTHMGHKNIVDYEQRPFRDVEDMENGIIKNWNSVVGKEDRVYHLGDLSFYPKEQTKHIVAQLRGRIFLIRGNHDTHSNNWFRDCGIQEVSKHPILLHKFIILSHEPVYLEKVTPYRNIHGHIHGNRTLSEKHFNASVENINYTPIDILKILKGFYNGELPEPEADDEGDVE